MRHALATILAAHSLPVQRGSPSHTWFRVSPLNFSFAEKEFFIYNFLGARSFAISGARHALVALLIALCSCAKRVSFSQLLLSPFSITGVNSPPRTLSVRTCTLFSQFQSLIWYALTVYFCNPCFALKLFIAFVEALAARVCLTIQIVFLSLFLNSTHVFPCVFASAQGPSRDRRAPD